MNRANLMKKHRVRLFDSDRAGGESVIAAAVLVQTLDKLLEAARRSVRFFFEGYSTKQGKRPVWLEQITAVQVSDLRRGSALLELTAPLMSDVPALVQGGLQKLSSPGTPDDAFISDSALDVCGRYLKEVLSAPRDQIQVDRGLLEIFADLGEAVGKEFRGIEIYSDKEGEGAVVTFTREDVLKIKSLRDNTPEERAVRLVGRLETISAQKPVVTVVLDDGTHVRANLGAHEPEHLRNLFDKEVAVSGVGHFRPDGRVSVLDIDFIEAARPSDDIFRSVLHTQLAGEVVQFLPQDEKTGVAAFFGSWPGDETDEEFFRALEGKQ